MDKEEAEKKVDDKIESGLKEKDRKERMNSL